MLNYQRVYHSLVESKTQTMIGATMIVISKTLYYSLVQPLIWVCLKIVYPIVPNGFADHDPYEKWLFHWEY